MYVCLIQELKSAALDRRKEAAALQAAEEGVSAELQQVGGGGGVLSVSKFLPSQNSFPVNLANTRKVPEPETGAQAAGWC
jgi:hypothetical protein